MVAYIQQRILVFRCPHCLADRATEIDVAVKFALIRYCCRRDRGGCDGVFTIHFDESGKTWTEPPQKCPNEINAQEGVHCDFRLAE